MTNGQVINTLETEWTKEYDKTSNKVIAHTPDPSRYFLPDDPQLVPLGLKVGRATMLPRARDDGSSLGVDHNRAGVVHVDPDGPGGGSVLDLGNVDHAMLKTAQATSHDPSQVFHNLAAISRQLMEAAAVSITIPTGTANPVLPDSYVVPQSNYDSAQIAEQQDSAHIGFQPVVEAAKPVRFPESCMETQSMTPVNTQQVSLRGLELQVERLTSMLAANQQSATVKEISTVPCASEVLPPLVVKPNCKDTLGIPFLQEDVGLLPEKQVIFQIPGIGATTARYHEVIDAPACVVLIYDTRFASGVQFLPADQSGLQEQTPFSLLIRETGAAHKVLSLGFQYTLGVLDMVLLVKELPQGAVEQYG